MSMQDLENIPLHAKRPPGYGPMQQARQASIVPAALESGGDPGGVVTLGSVADIHQINTPTEVDHYQIRRVIDIYVSPKTEALQGIGNRSTSCLPTQNTIKIPSSMCVEPSSA